LKKDKNKLLTDWVHQYADEMYRFARSRVQTAEVAEDLVQNTFLAALLALEHFRGDSSPKTWLFAILRNKIVDHHRNTFREPEKLQLSDVPAHNEHFFFNEKGQWQQLHQPVEWDEELLLDNPDFIKALDHCLEVLPKKWFAAIQLKYLEERKGAEIIQKLDISPANYWQILHRAKLNLRQCLENQWFKK
jgi:RNA polymerase sigma-70 factor (TIGR02943 family)